APACRPRADQRALFSRRRAAPAMSTKFLMPKILERVGFRGVLISNTIILGLLLMAFATIGTATPLWAIVLLAFGYGAFTSLQYTSMNTLVYADIPDDKASNASSIASTMQQISISFGVAAAGLTTALFIPVSSSSDSGQMIRGLHEAFLLLGGFTVLSTVVFSKLKSGDGANET